MNCAEARGLLARGVSPGSSSPERVALGFHLAGCADCRAYRASLNDHLLASLLAAEQAAPPPSVSAPAEPAPAKQQVTGRSWQASASRALWLGGLGLLATLVLVVVIIVGGAALSLFNIHRNVQAMIVPTGAAQAAQPAPPAGSGLGTALAVEALPNPTLPIAPTLTLAPTAPPPTATLPQPSATPSPTVPPATAAPEPPPAGGPVTVLLLGTDERPGETGPSRSDAIIIARIDPRGGRIALLSLPRDLWVDIPGYGSSRINAAHSWGMYYNDPEGGMGLARRTVSNLLGIPIDYTIQINFQSFIGAIDTLGGITVDVTKELYDDEFPTMDYGYTIAHFLPGPQQMDGATALMYSRIRHPDSDIERTRRQQAVVVAAIDRIRQQNVLASLKSLEDVTAALRGYVETDMPEERIIGLAWALRDFNPEHVERYLLDEDHISFGIGDDRWAAVAAPEAIKELVAKLIGS
ncbi:MAG TPA: LCP family protein [Roseiflexaceae bacterium]|nr:LCP family protein [Roseiflexaceae bacterium]